MGSVHRPWDPVDTSLAQKSNVRSVYRALCDLFEIIHRSLYVLYSSRRPLRSIDIVDIYTEYLVQYTALAIVLQLGENSTPAVIFTQSVSYSHVLFLVSFPSYIYDCLSNIHL